MLFYGLCRVLSWASNRVDDEANNDHHDHSVTGDDHVIITVKELAGIKPSVLQSIPVVDFNSEDSKDSFECVVCLSKLEDGDKDRLLPTCNHWFHADCIEKWLRDRAWLVCGPIAILELVCCLETIGLDINFVVTVFDPNML
ncbi:hypothetical protein YC2023_117378 [Brassica napus]